MNDKKSDINDEQNAGIDDLGWEKRILCSDESCIGVIGPDGRCKECGKKYEGPLPEQVFAEAAQAGEPAVSATADADIGSKASPPVDDDERQPAPADSEAEESPVTDDEWEQRILCSDESCIGVIGPDGRCKECGRPYRGD